MLHLCEIDDPCHSTASRNVTGERQGELTKSGAPKIVYLWNLEDSPPKQAIITPIFSELKWQDPDGNSVKGETAFRSLFLSGKVSKVADVRDVFVHLNDKKVFYSANLNSSEDRQDKKPDNDEFMFSTLLKLLPGKNQISVFLR